MASNYNRLPRPAVVFVENGEHQLVVRRETYEDIVRLDFPLQKVKRGRKIMKRRNLLLFIGILVVSVIWGAIILVFYSS